MASTLFVYFSLVLTVFTLHTDAQILFGGRCPKQKVIKNFDTERYLGRWYENQNYFAFFQLFGRCVTATYTLKKNGEIGVDNRNIGLFGQEGGITGSASFADPYRMDARLNVEFPSVPFGGGSSGGSRGNYWVLDTDYDSYSIVWSCNEKAGLFNTQILWILTRKRNPPKSVIAKALTIIRKRGLDTNALKKTDQNNCNDRSNKYY